MKNETWDSNAAATCFSPGRRWKGFERRGSAAQRGRNDPRVNMLYADLNGLPPIMVYYGAHEVLVGEAIEFAKRAKELASMSPCGPCSEGQHIFILGAAVCPRWTGRSRRLAVAAIQARLAVWRG